MNTNQDTGMHGDPERERENAGTTVEARIERTLVEVSSWSADEGAASDASAEATTPLWKYALASQEAGSSSKDGRETGILARMGRPIPQRRLAIAAGVMLLVTGMFVVTMPYLGRARSARMPVPQEMAAITEERAAPWQSRSSVDQSIDESGSLRSHASAYSRGRRLATSLSSSGSSLGQIPAAQEITLLGAGVNAGRYYGMNDLDRAPADVGAMARQVARNGLISVEVEDVNAAMARVAGLASEVHSEFVERSTLQGEGPNTQAEVVLRVASSRLDSVLGSIRAMGTITAESVAAEDVTAQVVDIEARLHNERRVEIELLDLLDKRTDAPLREVLDLRDKLREVRSEIERMQAARDRLSRLVALSTLTVSIRATPEETKEDPTESSFFKPLTEAVAASWHDGLSGLTGSIAWLVRVAVGGLLWWALIVGSILAWRRLGHVKHLPA